MSDAEEHSKSAGLIDHRSDFRDEASPGGHVADASTDKLRGQSWSEKRPVGCGCEGLHSQGAVGSDLAEDRAGLDPRPLWDRLFDHEGTRPERLDLQGLLANLQAPDQTRGQAFIRNRLVYFGLRNYDFPEAQTALVEKSKALLLKEWRNARYVCENYCANTGSGGEEGGRSDRFYHWGGLLGLMAFIEAGILPAPETPHN